MSTLGHGILIALGLSLALWAALILACVVVLLP